ncbi:MAG: T9SS type A sorting domain-containing protein [Bacteroidales bacterium]|jgi:hypothetical protein|nr:T9SS type A sorting domain-containing protein [Bacteroidales bacterium]
MKKLLLLFSVMLVSAALFSQTTILTTWEFGPTSFAPSITFNGAPTDGEIVSHIRVTNTGPEPVTIKVARVILDQVANTSLNFCWGGLCYGPSVDTSGSFETLGPGEFSDEFSGHLLPQGTMGISAVLYRFFDVDNPDNAVSVTVLYNSMFSLSMEENDTSNTTLLSGPVDDPIHSMIKVHNHLPIDLNMLVFRQPVFTVAGSENWMWFGGTEYDATVDTTGVNTIAANSVDETFEMYYDPDGNVGKTQMIYVFTDPTNPSNYSLWWVNFDAQPSAISEDLLAKTTFSPAYPNPADNFVSFNYEIPDEVNRAEIMITNLLGAVVYEGTLSGMNGTERIDVSNLTGGIYFVTLKLDNEVAMSQKILVQ